MRRFGSEQMPSCRASRDEAQQTPQRSSLPETACLAQNEEPNGPMGGMGEPTSYNSVILTARQCDPHRLDSLNAATLRHRTIALTASPPRPCILLICFCFPGLGTTNHLGAPVPKMARACASRRCSIYTMLYFEKNAATATSSPPGKACLSAQLVPGASARPRVKKASGRSSACPHSSIVFYRTVLWKR